MQRLTLPEKSDRPVLSVHTGADGLHLSSDIGKDLRKPDLSAQESPERDGSDCAVPHCDRWSGKAMNTAFLLMAQYEGLAIVPVEKVCADYFPQLKLDQFLRKIGAGEIRLPLVRAETGQKSAKGVHLQDLADYLDGRRDAARKELEQMTHE